MSLLFTVLVVLVIGGIVVVAAGRGEAMVEEDADRPEVRLPDGAVTGRDLRDVRFSTAVRGYRAAEVDALLERLARQLDETRTEREEPDAGRRGARAPYEAPPTA